jgi:DNA-binding IclR family transcriptional regulator
MQEPADLKPAVKSADRVLDLFEVLARWGQPMSHTDLALQLNIPKSSLTQLLHTLVQRGYIAFAPESRSYVLGPSLLGLARQRSYARDLALQARPVLEQLTRTCSESTALNVLRGDASVIVATVLGPHRLVSHMRQGDAAPLYATSGGKILLAFLPTAMRQEYLARVKPERILPNTLHTRTAIEKEIARVRESGVAFVHEEFTPGIVGIAVAVRAPGLHPDAPPLASLSIAMPSVRYSEALRPSLVDALQRAAQDLERQLAALDGSSH